MSGGDGGDDDWGEDEVGDVGDDDCVICKNYGCEVLQLSKFLCKGKLKPPTMKSVPSTNV